MAALIKGALLVSVGWMLAHGGQLAAATTYSDKVAFTAAAGMTSVATFEDVPVGQMFPFVSGGVLFTGAMQVVENLVLVPHAFWFGALASPTHFVLFSPVGGGPGFVGMEAVFPTSVTAGGFAFNCLGCDILPNASGLFWTTVDASGNTVEQGMVTVDLGGGSGQPAPGFFGLVTTKSFRSLRVARHAILPGVSEGNWMVDDVHYSTPPESPPPPAAGIPTLNVMALLGSALLLLVAGGACLRRGGRGTSAS